MITDLNNLAMPLIRYRVGDMGALGEPCVCGRGLPVLANVWGREYDFVVGPDGRRYHGEFFMYIFEDLRGAGVAVGQFQITQTDSTRLELALTLSGDLSNQDRATIASMFEDRIPAMNLDIRVVDDIPRLKSGKMRVIRNDLPR